MFRDIGLILFLVVLILFCWVFHGDSELKFWYDLAFVFSALFISSIWVKRDNLWLRITTFLKGNLPLRATFSYLIKISIKDANGIDWHLLVWNSKIKGFQPPGGVYKYYDNSIFKSLGVTDHDKFHQKNDLRLQLPARNYPSLLQWFKSGDRRERGQEREFYEELIDSNILPRTIFPYGRFRFLKEYRSPIQKSEHFDNILEIKFFEVYELMLNQEQIDYLEKMMAEDSPLFRFSNNDEINRKGYSLNANKDECRILEHTPLLIKNKLK